MINSANDEVSLDGLDKADGDRARSPSGWWQHGHGEATVTYKLRDWLFSRQRYWGEPFPIVYDENGLPVAVPDSMLPVLLPEVDDYSPKTFADDDADSAPEPPLSRATEWTTVELDLGDGPQTYRRETNTMPNWAGSCWYYLRYLDPDDDERLVDPELERYWMGPRAAGRRRRRRPVRRRRRARRAAPAVRPVLAQGAVRPGLRVQRGAVPPAGQPGLHLRLRLHRRARVLRAGRRGRGERRRVLPRGPSRSTASTARSARA